jgi:hypothetical protein
MKRFLLAAVAAFCVAGAVSPAQALVIGTADSSGSIPFGYFHAPYFQQIYNASSFAGPTSISQISFYDTLSPATTTPLADTFTFYLSTSNASIATFDTTNVTCPDATFTQVFSGKATLVNGRLDFALTSAFNYDPSQGNLVLTVKDFDFGSGGNLFLDVDKNVGLTNMRDSAFTYDYNQGLVTGFNDFPAVPEPATWGLMIGGFGLVGAAMRRKRRAVATFA